jgi:hypothetical protein
MKRRQFVETVAGAAVLAGPVAAKALVSNAQPAQAKQPEVNKNGPTVVSKTPTNAAKLGPASNTWSYESNKVFDEEVAFQKKYIDPETGILVIRLTNEPCVSHHIYPEAPISTPDGKRFIFARRQALDGRSTFWIGDLDLLAVRQITDEERCSAPVVTPDGKWFIYSVGRQVKRMSPETFEREVIFEAPADFKHLGGIVSVDYSGTRFLASATDKSGLNGLAVVEPFAGKVRIVYSGPDVRNPHGQYSKNADRKVLVQVNNGMVVDKFNNIIKLVGEKGASLVVVNDDGTNPVILKAGFSMLERVQGHECWVGPKDQVLTTLHRRLTVNSPWIQDRVVAVVPGEDYRVVGQGKGFTHIHASPDGEWWISDDNRTADVYIGSVKTARYKLVHRTGSTFGSAQFAHPHPFFLGDGKSVGWNSDVTGVPQIYVARIPEGFLDELT